VFTLDQLAHLVHGAGHGNAQHIISSLSSLARAGANDITYFDNPLLKPVLNTTKAGIVLLREEHLNWCPGNALIVADPLTAIKEIAHLLKCSPSRSPMIDVTAQVHSSVQLGEGVSIGPHVIIEEQVVLADGVQIGAHSIIENAVRVGKDSFIGTNASILKNSLIGDNVTINSGCVLGSSPFNYLKEHGVWQQGVALGGVTVASGVRIGANTVIDKGSVGDTYLAEGVCIDNLVHIAHDVYIGANTAIAGCAAIGAHSIIGADCIIGGASCIAANVRLADDVVISGMSTVSKSLTKPGIYSSGTLVHDHNRWRRNAARFRRLDDYIIKLTMLERKISEEF
jgi:UDP-3-O-[3-hydroxymyristoyl] glucosamine N-acyltransferase